MNSAALVGCLGKVPLLGRLLRWYAQRYEEGSVVTIAHGHAAGLRWRRHHRYVNGYWIGHYELPIQEALKRELQPGAIFYDVGANAGFFTLIAARCVGPSGKVIAFDPSPENMASIREQIELNGLAMCVPVQKALSDFVGSAEFSFDNPGAATGKLGAPVSSERSLYVEVTTLDEAAKIHGPPAFIKMDIEGAEVAALRGAVEILKSIRPVLLIEIHGPECEAGVRQLLQAAGYHFSAIDGTRIAGRLTTHVLAQPE